MKTIKTTQLTANKKFKEIIKENIKNIFKVQTNHIPSIGNVTVLKDIEGNILGKYFREETGMTLYIN